MRLPFVVATILLLALSFALQAAQPDSGGAGNANRAENRPADNSDGITARMGQEHTSVPSWVVALVPTRCDQSITFSPLGLQPVKLGWRVVRFPADYRALRVSLIVTQRIEHRDVEVARLPLTLPVDNAIQTTLWRPKRPGQYSFRLRLEPTDTPADHTNVAESRVHNCVVLAPAPEEVHVAQVAAATVETQMPDADGMTRVEVRLLFTAADRADLVSEARYRRTKVQELMASPWASVLPQDGEWLHRLRGGDATAGPETQIRRVFRFSQATWPTELGVRVLQLSSDTHAAATELAVLTLGVAPYPATDSLILRPRLVAPLQTGDVPAVRVTTGRE